MLKRVYIKAWWELSSKGDISCDKDILTHRTLTGSYCEKTHGKHGGSYVEADVCNDGWASNNVSIAAAIMALPPAKDPIVVTGTTLDYYLNVRANFSGGLTPTCNAFGWATFLRIG